MEDLLIATEAVEENMEQLDAVLQLLQNNGLTVNLEKCIFFQNSVRFLGSDISNEGIRPGKKKLKAVEQYPEPKSIHQFDSLISKPVTKLLKKDALWEWGREQVQAFTNLKSELIHNALLNIFNPSLPINMYTDASRDKLGCILTQVTDSGENPIHFYSRQISNEEKQYHSFELEFLAIVVGLQKFRHYLLGAVFKIITASKFIN